ncbi:MAG: prolipoprotein diacylglyceryl transferase [Clostridia bacterium]|nr:prolipoprotein diacylglyceryl transferase [Clostridia bacterium]
MDEIAFHIFGIAIYWYGIFIGLGLVAGVALAVFTAKYRGLKRDMPLELILWIFPPAILFARLYFCIFNGGPWGLNFFAIWNGGLAVYGSIIGGAIGLVLYCVIRKQNFLKVADVVVPSLALGQAIGRWGCYFSHCCYGLEVTNPAFQCFPFALEIGGTWHWATMLLESLCDVGICIALYFLLRKGTLNGSVFCGYMITYGLARAIIEGIRGESLMLGASGIRVSQLLSILIMIAGVVLFILLVRKNKKKQE